MRYVPDITDRKILALLQDTLPLEHRPFFSLAKQTGLTEEEVVGRIRHMKEEGVLRRMGAVLRHRQAGYANNVLTAWSATPAEGEEEKEALDRVGETLAARAYISHCYARKCFPEWKWPVFAMLHARSKEEMASALAELKEALPGEEVRILETVKEWKKTSMRYFT